MCRLHRKCPQGREEVVGDGVQALGLALDGCGVGALITMMFGCWLRSLCRWPVGPVCYQPRESTTSGAPSTAAGVPAAQAHCPSPGGPSSWWRVRERVALILAGCPQKDLICFNSLPNPVVVIWRSGPTAAWSWDQLTEYWETSAGPPPGSWRLASSSHRCL